MNAVSRDNIDAAKDIAIACVRSVCAAQTNLMVRWVPRCKDEPKARPAVDAFQAECLKAFLVLTELSRAAENTITPGMAEFLAVANPRPRDTPTIVVGTHHFVTWHEAAVAPVDWMLANISLQSDCDTHGRQCFNRCFPIGGKPQWNLWDSVVASLDPRERYTCLERVYDAVRKSYAHEPQKALAEITREWANAVAGIDPRNREKAKATTDPKSSASGGKVGRPANEARDKSLWEEYSDALENGSVGSKAEFARQKGRDRSTMSRLLDRGKGLSDEDDKSVH